MGAIGDFSGNHRREIRRLRITVDSTSQTDESVLVSLIIQNRAQSAVNKLHVTSDRARKLQILTLFHFR